MITRSRVKKIVLTLLILMSFFLSYSLWFTGVQPETESVQTSSQSNASLVDHSSEEVYTPYQMVVHGETSQSVRQSDVLETFNETFDTIVINEISSIQKVDRESYYQLLSLNVDRWFEGVFSGQVPIGLINDRFENLPNDLANAGIDRVAFNLDESDNLLLYNSTEETLYTADIQDMNTNPMNQLLSTEEISTAEVMTQEINNDYVYLPTERMDIQYRDFVIERMPNSFFVDELFEDTSSVEVANTSDATRYVDITTEVIIDNENYVLSYLRQRQETEELSNVERFTQSYGQLNRLVNWSNGVHYYGYDEENNTLSYQRYMDGFPIFDENHEESMVNIRVTAGGLANMEVPLRVLQTPISTEGEQAKTMPSGLEVVGQLESIPGYYMENVDGLRLGFQWEEVEETSEVVHLEPAWFVESDNQWHNLDDFVEENGGTV